MQSQEESISILRANFPQGSPLPGCLTQLSVFEHGRLETYGCDFSMSLLAAGGREILEIWFGGNMHAIDHLAPFGRTSDGSLFALWLLPKNHVDAQPVVTLGSAGERAVVAENLGAFLELMCNCVEFVPEAAESNNFELLESIPDRLGFVAWARANCGIATYRSPETLIRRAQLMYPSFRRGWMTNAPRSDRRFRATGAIACAVCGVAGYLPTIAMHGLSEGPGQY